MSRLSRVVSTWEWWAQDWVKGSTTGCYGTTMQVSTATSSIKDDVELFPPLSTWVRRNISSWGWRQTRSWQSHDEGEIFPNAEWQGKTLGHQTARKNTRLQMVQEPILPVTWWEAGQKHCTIPYLSPPLSTGFAGPRVRGQSAVSLWRKPSPWNFRYTRPLSSADLNSGGEEPMSELTLKKSLKCQPKQSKFLWNLHYKLS